MAYFTLMVIVFVLGYMCIALEHTIKVDKAASALLIGVLTWSIYVLNAQDILGLNFSEAWKGFASNWNDSTVPQHLKDIPKENIFLGGQLSHCLCELSETLFFLLGAMTIVEIVDQHNGFKIITDKISATSKVKLLWIIGILTFFMSAVLDNLTTTIVILALLRKLIGDQKTRWYYASIVVLAANAGGAWSPIGDVTTIMLWIGGQVTAAAIVKGILVPSLLCLIVPLLILSFTMKGDVERPESAEGEKSITSHKEQILMLSIGVAGLLFVPVFKTITHMAPYMGMLFSLGCLWVVTEIIHRNKPEEIKKRLTVVNIVKRVDLPTIFFFLGILTAVGALQSAGHLSQLSVWLKDVTDGNVYIIDTIIGVLSSIVDNVPLVAGAKGMYEIDPTIGSVFAQDGLFWQMLAYCAGTGGSILIIGSAAGVAAMGIEKIDFVWYLKNISWLALVGYFAGIVWIFVENAFLYN